MDFSFGLVTTHTYMKSLKPKSHVLTKTPRKPLYSSKYLNSTDSVSIYPKEEAQRKQWKQQFEQENCISMYTNYICVDGCANLTYFEDPETDISAIHSRLKTYQCEREPITNLKIK